jgi:UDP-N-acetylmuramoyl-L-alanyl-D-glutamate--2,6-diaminopimelate ligase
MLRLIKNSIKFFLPKVVLNMYHGAISRFAAFYFHHPSEQLVVIGVTGTNGKTTTVNLIARILQEAGNKTGYMSTATINTTGEVEQLNPIKMTMASGWIIQRSLAQILKNGCTYAFIEFSSEGMAQGRHLGINVDVAVFTNLTPEHIDSHGSFEKYRDAKAILFRGLDEFELTPRKLAINPNLQKTIVTNLDDAHGQYFGNFKAAAHLSYGMQISNGTVGATHTTYSPKGISFRALDHEFNLQLKGQFDVYNAMAAIAVGVGLGIDAATMKKALEETRAIPGRVEVIHANFFNVIVDYAYEPEEMKQLYETVSRWPYRCMIQVLGPTGGGRDKARISVLGEMAGRFANTIFISTDDPYDEDPKKLAEQMLAGAVSSGKIVDNDVFVELDRRAAIHRALEMAEPNDLVLVTGKGADQTMALAHGNYIPWDDRQVVRDELDKI